MGSILDRMDAGEAELLCVLSDAPKPLDAEDGYRICSADAVVFKYLGAKNWSEFGVSLEEILTAIGRGQRLPPQFSKEFKQRHARDGFGEGHRGQALR